MSVSRIPATGNERAFCRQGSDMVQVSDVMVQPLLSGEKLRSLHFRIPGKEGWPLPTEEVVMLLKDMWVLLGRAWAVDRQEPQTSTLQPWEMVFLQVLLEGVTFPGILPCNIFSLAFCFGLTVGMSLNP